MSGSINLLSALSDNIKIDTNKCIVCGECVERCILDNLRMAGFSMPPGLPHGSQLPRLCGVDCTRPG